MESAHIDYADIVPHIDYDMGQWSPHISIRTDWSPAHIDYDMGQWSPHVMTWDMSAHIDYADNGVRTYRL